MNNKELNDVEEEKKYLLELMKMQNEALKRIYKNTIENDKINPPKSRS